MDWPVIHRINLLGLAVSELIVRRFRKTRQRYLPCPNCEEQVIEFWRYDFPSPRDGNLFWLDTNEQYRRATMHFCPNCDARYRGGKIRVFLSWFIMFFPPALLKEQPWFVVYPAAIFLSALGWFIMIRFYRPIRVFE